MTNPQNTVVLKRLAIEIAKRAKSSRLIVAIAGAPGSGKSTAADDLQIDLERTHGQKVQVVPMDGFHYDDAVLAELGRGHRKGAPDTFDVVGLELTLVRLTKAYLTEDVPVPVFDRAMELSRANARLINRHTRIILLEGNYILLKEEPWARLGPHFDVTVMIECDETTLRARLLQRWADHGFDMSTASEKVEGNDLPNARRVINNSRQAEFTLVKA
ncbi:MAG: nucleoside/nucleotide kinase family protein [Albidovulum sp.]